jgi:hypothetical protein
MFKRRPYTQHNDTQNNGIQHKDTQNNDIQNGDFQRDNTQHKDASMTFSIMALDINAECCYSEYYQVSPLCQLCCHNSECSCAAYP